MNSRPPPFSPQRTEPGLTATLSMRNPSLLHRLAGRPVLISGLIILTASLLGVAAPVPPAEQLLPDDTLVVGCAPDFAKVHALLQRTPLMQLWRDPAMKPFRDKFLARWDEEFLKPLERDLGIRFNDYTALPQGQLTVALTQDGWDGTGDTSPAFLLLLDAKDKSGQLRTNLADVRQKWVHAGKTLRTEKIRNVEFVILTLTSNDTPKTLKQFLPERPTRPDTTAAEGDAKPGKPTELVVGQFESMLILGNSTRTVEKVVARLTGGSAPVLAEVEGFEADRLAQFRDAPVFGWVNARRLVELLRKSASAPLPAQPDAPPPLDFRAILQAVGLTGLNTLAVHYREAVEGGTVQVYLRVPESGRSGIFKLMATEAKDATPPPFVPADVLKFQRLRIDGQKGWVTLEKMAGDMSPQFLSVLNFFLQTAERAGKERDSGFDVRKDLIGSLGDDWVTWQKPPRGNTLAQLEESPSALLIGSAHAAKLALALRNLFSVSAPATEREFLGRKIYTVTPPMLAPSNDPSGEPRKLHYAASGGYVGFSTDVALLEEWLRSAESPPKSLVESAGLRESIQTAGGAGGGWLAYENEAAGMRALFEALKNDPEAANRFHLGGLLGVPAGYAAEGKGVQGWFDFSLLPAWDAVAKYFYHTVTSASANVEGITLRVYNPTPPGLRKSGAP